MPAIPSRCRRAPSPSRTPRARRPVPWAGPRRSPRASLRRRGSRARALSTTAQADLLRSKVECTVAMDGAIGDNAARAFAVRFYGALGYRRSVGNAVAVLAAKQLPDELLPRCLT